MYRSSEMFTAAYRFYGFIYYADKVCFGLAENICAG